MFRSSGFYFVALLLAGGIVAGALAPTWRAEQEFGRLLRDVRVNGYVFTASDLETCTTSSATNASYTPDLSGEGGVWRLSASRAPGDVQGDAGVVCFIPAELMQIFRARGARVSIQARMRADRPSRHFRLAIEAAGGQSSGWTTFPTGLEYESFHIEAHDLDGPSDQPGWVRIWPDLDGVNGMIEVRELRIEVLAS